MYKIGLQASLKNGIQRSLSLKAKRSVPEKISVQLLKDFENLGSAGEIVKVKPAHMRNYLHHNNGACYLTATQGPRIPVVKKSKKERNVEVVVEAKETEEAKDTATNAMSLDELSSLFKTLKGNKKSSVNKGAQSDQFHQSFESSTEDSSYTSSEIKEVIPNNHTIELTDSLTLPISREYFVSLVYEMAGIKIATNTIKFQSQGKVSNEITAPGEYTWLLEVPHEKQTVRKTIFVTDK